MEGLDGLAVPDDGDVVGHIGDLVELVGDDDARHTLALEPEQQVQQGLGVGLVEGGGRLVQNEETGVFGQGLGDLHQLLLAHADVLDEGTGGLAQAHDLQVLVRLAVGVVPVDGKGLAPLVAQEHVLADGHVGHQGQLLVDDDDALGLAVRDLGELADLALVDDVAGIAAVGVDAAEDVHEGGLARAVLSHQGVDGPLLHLQIHVVQCPDAREQLGDIPHFQDVFRQDITSFVWFRARREAPALPEGFVPEDRNRRCDQPARSASVWMR